MNIKVEHNNGIITENLTFHIGAPLAGEQPIITTLIDGVVNERLRTLQHAEIEDAVIPFVDELNAYRCSEEWKAKRTSFVQWFSKMYPHATPKDVEDCQRHLSTNGTPSAQLLIDWWGRLDTNEFAAELARRVGDGRLEKHEAFDLELKLDLLDCIAANMDTETPSSTPQDHTTLQFLKPALTESSFLEHLPAILTYFGHPDNLRQLDLLALYWLLARNKYIPAIGSRAFFEYLNAQFENKLIPSANLRQFKSRGQEMPPATYRLPDGLTPQKRASLESDAYTLADLLGLTVSL